MSSNPPPHNPNQFDDQHKMGAKYFAHFFYPLLDIKVYV